jgi:carbonic anhydrase/acetyltransferase-like protein (isoleucine patch superfamily)
MAIYQLEDWVPQIAASAWVADSASVIGRVRMAEGASVWYGAVLRGDVGRIRIGRSTNVQDGSVVHMSLDISHAEIGDYVTIGHAAVIHGARIETGALIGIGAILLDNCVVGAESLVAAGSLVATGTQIPPRKLAIGRPARVIRDLTEEEWTQGRHLAERYVGVARRHAMHDA